jgi:hypothetical protein
VVFVLLDVVEFVVVVVEVIVLLLGVVGPGEVLRHLLIKFLSPIITISWARN